jgi:hypothetical protein
MQTNRFEERAIYVNVGAQDPATVAAEQRSGSEYIRWPQSRKLALSLRTPDGDAI